MVTSQHIVSAYDKELAILNRTVAEMGGRVEHLLEDAVASFVRADTEIAEQVIKADKDIDALDIDINKQATQLLALRQPMAADLRAIIASLKISNDLERMGDYVKNISRRTITLSNVSRLPTVTRSIELMAEMVEEMIREVLDAYLKRDAEHAREVILKDENVDQLHTALFREILAFMMEDSENITMCTHFLFIAKNIERIGDHATNIAEQVYYIAEGTPYEEGHVSADIAASVTLDGDILDRKLTGKLAGESESDE